MPQTENFFFEGMHSDNEISLQPPNTYRKAIDRRLISNADNTYSLENIKGNKLSFSLDKSNFSVIGWTSLNERLITISANDNESGEGELGVVNFNPDKTGVYTTVYHHLNFNLSKNFPIRKIIAIHENENIERVYWTDWNNNPRTLNIADPDVQNVNINTLDFNIPETKGNIEFYTKITGSLLSGVYGYSYRQITNDGYATTWSVPAIIIPVPIDNIGLSNIQQVTSLMEYQKIQGGDPRQVSNRGTRLTISNLEPNKFDKIEVAFIHMVSLDTPGDIAIFSKQNFDTNSLVIDHLNNDRLTDLLLNEISALKVVLKKVKDMFIMNNILFSTNIVTDKGLENFKPSDNSSLDVRSFTKMLPVSPGFSGIYENNLEYHHKGPYFNQDRVKTIGINYMTLTQLPKGITYKLSGGDLFDDSGVQIFNGSIFNTWTDIRRKVYGLAGTPVITPIIQINKYKNNAGVNIKKTIEVENDYMDYKGTAVSTYLKGYWRQETYRVGILPVDLYGNIMFGRWLADVTIPNQYDDITNSNEQWWDNVLTMITDGGTSDYEPRINIKGIKISGLDLTDIIDKISGFYIVRAERDKQVLAQGMLWPTTHENSEGNDSDAWKRIRPIMFPQYVYDYHWDQSDAIRAYTTLLYSPEYLFEDENGLKVEIESNILAGDKVRIVDSYTVLKRGEAVFNVEGGNPSFDGTPTDELYIKFYINGRKYGFNTSEQTGLSFGSEQEIFDLIPLEENGVINGYDKNIPEYSFYNQARSKDAVWASQTLGGKQAAGIGSKASILIVKNDNIFGVRLNQDNFSKVLVNIIRPKTNLYGSTGETALANTQYITTGHYQEITQAVKDDIKTTVNGVNKYIFNDIEIFGGDCFVNIFDIRKNIKNLSQDGIDNQKPVGQALFFPCESTINLAMRKGQHYALSRGDYLEDFRYNTAYSSKHTGIKYAALPVDHNFTDKLEVRTYNSEIKVSGETIDSFRIFKTNNFRDVNINLGEVNNISGVGTRLYYWQNRGVGYMGVLERSLITDTSGRQVTLGTGGILSRYDELTNYYGNQNQFSLSVTPTGFVWFDLRRKAFMKMGFNGKVTKDSVIKGLRSHFKNNAIESILINDNHLTGKGIISEYDSVFEEVIMSFRQNGTDDFVIAFNDIISKFTTFYNFRPLMMLNHNELLLSTSVQDKEKIYVHNFGDLGMFYDIVYDDEIDIVINPERKNTKVYDNFESIGNDKMFDDLTYTNSYQNVSETNIVDGNNKYYKFRNRMWYGAIPRDNKARFRDHYLKITLKNRNSNGNINISRNKFLKLVSFITNYRISN